MKTTYSIGDMDEFSLMPKPAGETAESVRCWLHFMSPRPRLRNERFHCRIERDADTGLSVGSVSKIPDAHSQGTTMEELRENLIKVTEMLLSDGTPTPTIAEMKVLHDE